MKKNALILIISLILPFSIHAQFELMYYSNPKYFMGDITTPTSYKYKDYYSYDSLALELQLSSSSVTTLTAKKSKEKLLKYTNKKYDELGRLIHHSQYGENWNYKKSSSYEKQGVVITRSDNYYSERVYNSNNRIVRNYYENYNARGKKTYARLTKYTYQNNKIMLMESSYKGDTQILYPTAKYFYQNDTGLLYKKEKYKKGILEHTTLYDCNLVTASKTKSKDSSTFCNNVSTDDRGYTYKTFINQTDKYEIKSIYTYNPANKLIAFNKYSLHDNQQHLIYSYELTKDTIFYKTFRYNKKFSKLKYAAVQKSLRNNTGKTIFTEKVEHFGNSKKKYTSIAVYSYFKNGLIKQSMFESRNWNDKIRKKSRKVYSYSFFNQ
jgi:hypothetical protein